MTITGRQIRAARGLLEWNAEDLSRKSGINRVTISKIESDLVQPQEKTLTSILKTFDKHGVEFLPETEGVQIRKQETRVFSGKAGYRQLLDHVYETLKEDGGRIRQFNFSDGKYLAYADDFVGSHLERMADIKNLDARVLTVEGETNLQTSYCEYRWMDKVYKPLTAYYIFNDNVVLSLNDMGYKRDFLCVNYKFLAERYAEQFDLFWNLSDPQKKKRGK